MLSTPVALSSAPTAKLTGAEKKEMFTLAETVFEATSRAPNTNSDPDCAVSAEILTDVPLYTTEDPTRDCGAVTGLRIGMGVLASTASIKARELKGPNPSIVHDDVFLECAKLPAGEWPTATHMSRIGEYARSRQYTSN
jgi:hypothetical protein